mgnify:CR=1 FL=1
MLYRKDNMDTKNPEKDKRYIGIKECKFATLIHMCANFDLPKSHFEYIQEVKAKKKKKSKVINFGILDEETEEDVKKTNNLFFFNLGGISHAEVSSIEKVGKEIGYQVAIGSNDIFNANEYLKLAGSHVSNKGKVINIPRENAKNANSSIASDVRIIANSKGAETQLIDKSE